MSIACVPRNMIVGFFFRYHLWKLKKETVKCWIEIYKNTLKAIDKMASDSAKNNDVFVNREFNRRIFIMRCFVSGHNIYMHRKDEPEATILIDDWNFIWNWDSCVYIVEANIPNDDIVEVEVSGMVTYFNGTRLSFNNPICNLTNDELMYAQLSGDTSNIKQNHKFKVKNPKYKAMSVDNDVSHSVRTILDNNKYSIRD